MINVDNSNQKQSEGVWTSFGDSEFKVGASSSTKFQRFLNRLQAPHRKKIEKGTLDPKISKEILCKAMAGGLLIDWKDVVDANKKPVDFSIDMAERALLNNDDLREYLLDFAQDQENYRTEEAQELGK